MEPLRTLLRYALDWPLVASLVLLVGVPGVVALSVLCVAELVMERVVMRVAKWAVLGA